MTDLIGQSIDHYRIEKLLGQGGMGIIYQATDLKLQRPVAIKVMHEHLASHRQFQERFLQEARTAATLDHPNIVKVITFSPEAKRLYIVMELVMGGSLRDYLNRLPSGRRYLEVDDAIALVRQMAEALHYAHQSGMTHRDVKPENILLKPVPAANKKFPYRAMLTDFGLAKVSESITHTMTGKPVGTFPYMAPEQIQSKEVDGRTDLYALGILLYEITVGELPYTPITVMDAFRMHVSDPIPVPSRKRPEFPKPVEKVIFKALAKKPEDRYQNGSEFAAVLSRLQFELSDQHATASDTSQGILEKVKTDSVHKVSLDSPAPVVQPKRLTVSPAVSMPSFAAATPAQDSIIIATNDGQEQQVVAVSKPIMTIGRDPDHDIVLRDKAVSRDHAVLERKNDGNYYIRDLGSRNSSVLGETLLTRDTPEEWMYGQTLRIGHFRLRLQSGSNPNFVPLQLTNAGGQESMGSYRLSGLNLIDSDQPITMTLTPANVKIEPGTSAQVKIQLTNMGRRTEQVHFEVRGVPGDWAEILDEMALIPTGETFSTTVTFRPPRRANSTAGRHIYTLRAQSLTQQMEIANITGLVHILPFQEFTVNIRPKRIHGRGITTLSLSNLGNASTDFSVLASNADNSLNFDVGQPAISLDAGQSEDILIEVTPRSKAVVHGAKLLTFDIRATASNGELQLAQGELLTVNDFSGSPVQNVYVAEVAAPAPYSGIAAPYQPINHDIYPPILPPEYHDRGGCLTLWLSLYSIFGLLLFPTLVISSFAIAGTLVLNSASAPIFLIILIVCWLFFFIYGLAVIQAWNWKRWAFFLLGFMSFFLLPIGPFLTLTWWLLVRDKNHSLS